MKTLYYIIALICYLLAAICPVIFYFVSTLIDSSGFGFVCFLSCLITMAVLLNAGENFWSLD